MRSAALFEQPRGKRAQAGPTNRAPEGPRRKGEWFLHDDRAEDPPARQRAAPAARHAGRLPAANHSWEYKDLDGKVHGPFSSQKMVQWVNKDFFQMDLQVRSAGTSGSWTSLQQKLPQMSDPPAGGTQEGTMPHVTQHTSPQPDAVRARDSAFSRLDISESSSIRRGAGRGSDDGASGRGGIRGGNDSGRGRGGRQQEGRNRRGGGRGSRTATQAGPRAALAPGLARSLFTSDASQATDQPLWRYIDLSGQIQGPFTASNMVDWYTRGYLADPHLLIVGHDRQVAPPNLPPIKLYQPLGELLSQGKGYRPVTPEDIKFELAQLQTPSQTQIGDSIEAASASLPEDAVREPRIYNEGASMEATVQETAQNQEELRQPVVSLPASDSGRAAVLSAEGGANTMPASSPGAEAHSTTSSEAADAAPNEIAQPAVMRVPAGDEETAAEKPAASNAEPAQSIAIAGGSAATSQPNSESSLTNDPSSSEPCIVSVDSSADVLPVPADGAAAALNPQD